MKMRILGCGASGGVPLIGCSCAVCASTDPRNKRSRVSISVERGATRVVVDASPDLRQQFLAAGIGAIDAAILTHAHADHLHGIDDLRAVNWRTNAPLDVWADRATLAEAVGRFGYAFNPPTDNDGKWYSPALVARPIEGPFRIGELAVAPFTQIHGGRRAPTLGLRFGRLAYSTDVKEMPEESFAALAGIEVWVVDCLTETPNPAHSHLGQTLEWIARVQPRRAILTHMNHSLDYRELAAKLPPGVEPGYDGMEVLIDD